MSVVDCGSKRALVPWALQSVRRFRAGQIHQERHYQFHHSRVKPVTENFQRGGALRDSLAYPFFEGEITSVMLILSTSTRFSISFALMRS